LFSGCQIGYLFHVSYNHLALLNSKISIDEALQSTSLTEEQKRKIRLTQEVRQFAFDQLGLNKSKNYSDFVDLKRTSVTYAVMASSKWKLEPYLWNFPFVGHAPYKGYYIESLAKEEAEEMKKKDYDVYVRGVSAFSTLGKLNDPLLSSMLNYTDADLVNTIIHELTHTTLFIKDNIDFNERLAVFVANKGTEMFYKALEGPDSKTMQMIQFENEDDTLFSQFITKELNDLKKWYENFDHKQKITAEEKENIRQKRFEEIKINFTKNLKQKLKTKSYSNFSQRIMNNAVLGNYNTYMKDLDVFEKVYQKNGRNIAVFLKKCAELNAVDDPEATLKLWAQQSIEP
jgi:predicted aminopeptidase